MSTQFHGRGAERTKNFTSGRLKPFVMRSSWWLHVVLLVAPHSLQHVAGPSISSVFIVIQLQFAFVRTNTWFQQNEVPWDMV